MGRGTVGRALVLLPATPRAFGSPELSRAGAGRGRVRVTVTVNSGGFVFVLFFPGPHTFSFGIPGALSSTKAASAG